MRVAVVSTCSGAGKTTLARKLAARYAVPHIELDSIHHLAGWRPNPDFEKAVAAAIAQPAWIADGNYHGRLRGAVTDQADLVLWLDLPISVCVWRMAKRTVRRRLSREELWNGNRETFHNAVLARDSLFRYSLSTYRRRRREMPERLRGRAVVRLRSQREVDAWLTDLEAADTLTP